ncbi:MAG TPA: oligosaccharide flippase family protein, partial [Thermoplasmata archaeon]|nr:oligosaccharide flippase family protein [Thermoplasmata archaeon]
MDGSSAEGTVAENGSPPTNRFSIGLSSTGVFLISLAIQAIGLGATFFLARNIGFNAEGKALLGTVQLYLIIASSINGIGDLRIGTAYVFFVARGRNATEITGTYLVLRLGMVAVAGVFLFLLGVVPGTGFTWAHTSDQIAVLAVFMVLPILWSIQTVYTQLTVAQGNSTRGQLPLLVESLVRTPILVWAAFENRTLEALTLAYAAGAVASTLMSLPAVARNTRAFSRSEAVALFRYAWPLMGSLALLYLANNTAPLIVNADVGTVGLNEFLAANAWRILALSLPAAVAIPLFPHLSGLHRQGEFETVRAATWKALRYTAMIVIPGVIALITYRSNLLNITTNATYVPVAAYPLAILAASVIPAALSQIIGTSLNAIGRQRLELYLTSLQVVALFGT